MDTAAPSPAGPYLQPGFRGRARADRPARRLAAGWAAGRLGTRRPARQLGSSRPARRLGISNLRRRSSEHWIGGARRTGSPPASFAQRRLPDKLLGWCGCMGRRHGQ